MESRSPGPSAGGHESVDTRRGGPAASVAGSVAGACAGGDDAFAPPQASVAPGRDACGVAGGSPRDQRVPGAPGRSRAVDDARAAIVSRLTDRDRSVAGAIARHRVLTTDQLVEAFFPSHKRAWKRLALLHRRELLARFRPYHDGWGGAEPFHYVLGRTGAWLIAAERGEDPVRAARAWRADRAMALAHQRNLAHLVGVNDLWAGLAGGARRAPHRLELLTWLTEVEVGRWSGEVVRPDAFLEWREGGDVVDAFLEYDRGTEALRVLWQKAAAYERLEEERGATSWVLFAFASRGREATARAALAGATAPIATASLDRATPPSDAVWLPLRHGDERVRLAQLARVPKPPEALHRAALGSPRAWRFDRGARGEEAPFDA